MSFHAPLFLFLLLPVWWLAWRWSCSALVLLGLQQPLSIRHPRAGNLPTAKHVKTRRLYYPVMLGLIVSLLVFALAQPVKPGRALPGAPPPVDLLLVVDTAVTMGLQDYQLADQAVSRLAMSQWFLQDWLDEFQGQRVSLLVLGHPPTRWLPWTVDMSLAKHFLQRLRPAMVGRASALGDALALAADSKSLGREQVLVLISDGVFTSGQIEPTKGAKSAKESGFTVHSIAVGGDRPAEAAPKAGLLYEPVNTALLRDVAQAGGGSAYHARDAQGFATAMAAIEAQHLGKLPASPAQQLQLPLYHWFLLLSLGVLALLVGWRRT